MKGADTNCKRYFGTLSIKTAFFFLAGVLISTILFSQPIINSLNPGSGAVGAIVTISGSGFSTTAKDNIVYFGASKATILSANPSSIVVTVPLGTTYQPVTVTANRLTAYSPAPFNITVPAPFNAVTSSSFSRTDFNTGTYPNFITTTDMDGDSKPDLVILNQNANTISLLRNTGGAEIVAFAPPVNYDGGSHPFGVAVGDFDGDGKPDIAIGNYDSSKIIVYKNAGTPGTLLLTDKQQLISGLNPISIGIADFDGDGKTDIAAVNNNGRSVSLFKNTSTGDTISFAAKKDFALGDWPQRMAIADFNGDRKPDIAVPNFNDSTVSILRNTSSDGNISFDTRINYATGNAPFHVRGGDLNGDGRPEMVVSNSNSGTISIYKNVGTGGALLFSPKMDLTCGSSPLYTDVGDLDGDAKPDLTVVNFHSNNLYIFRNNSDSNALNFEFRTALATGSLPRVATIADVNGDGQPDICCVNSISNTFTVMSNRMRAVPVIRFFSPTSGTTDTVITIRGSRLAGTTSVTIGGVPANSFTVSDTTIKATVSTGGTGDVVVSTQQGNAVMPGFTFIHPAPVINSISPESGLAGTEVIIKGKNFRAASGNLVVYFGAVKGAVSFANDSLITVPVPASASYYPITVTVNSSTAYSARPFRVTFPGSGNGIKGNSFAPRKSYPSGGNPRSIAIQDFDGDGKPDLFVTNQSSATASVFRNTSTQKNISLATKQDLNMEVDPFGIAAGDFDGDGKTDIAVSNANSGSAGSVSIRRNTSSSGNISFETNYTLPVGNGPHGIAVADMDVDGKPDIVVTAGNSGIVALFKNTSDSISRISFEPQVNFNALFQHPEAVTLADLDGDNKPEIITEDFAGNSVSIWRNLSYGGQLSFAGRISYPAGSNPVALCAGDFDNDGKADLAVANYNSHTVTVIKNNSTPGVISFAGSQNYSTGQFPRAISAGDIDGDGRIDIVVPCNTPSSVNVFRNTSSFGTLSFADRIEYLTGIQPPGVTVGDLDGDNKPEIVVADDYANVSILRNRVDEPIIKAFTPTAATADSTITITGENFTGTTQVVFGGMPASSFQVVSDTTIVAKVDTGSTGKVKVITPWGADSLGVFIYIPPAPIIVSFTPSSGTVGSVIRIVGKNFNKVTVVKFHNTSATSFTIHGDTVITAIVGKGASGNVIVSGPDGVDTLSGFSFIVPVPRIISFTPSVAEAGTTVFIKGRNFTWVTGVSFGNTNASAFSVDSDSLITAMADNGSSGVVRVTGEFGTDTLGSFIFLGKETMILYPNPAKDNCVVVHRPLTRQSVLKLVDMNGRIAKTIVVSANETHTRLDLSKVQAGIYKLFWDSGEGSLVQTIVIQ